MVECICSSCKNLKWGGGQEGAEGEYLCEFGYPSEQCEDCQPDRCEETCKNYRSDEEDDIPRTVKCKGCGKELQAILNEGGDDDIFCVDCYLNR